MKGNWITRSRAGAASLALAVFAAACGPSELPTAKPETQNGADAASGTTAFDLLPLAEGNRWTYVRETEQQTANAQPVLTIETRIWHVEEVKDIDGGKQAVIKELNEDEKPVGEIVFRVSDDGVYLVSQVVNQKRYTLNPPLPIALWPNEDGKTIEWNGTGLTDDPNLDLETTITAKGMMEVDTASGRVKAYRVDISTRPKGGGGNPAADSSYWFAPGKGVVRNVDKLLVQNVYRKTTMKLKGETIR
jgi:hypothetical protein